VSGNTLVAGYRRYEAARQLGWDEIEAVECVGDPGVINLIENMQREGLSTWDEIQGIRSVFGSETSQAEIARSLSKSRTWVKPRVDVWSLPSEFLDKVRDGRSGVAEIRKMLAKKRPKSETVDARLPVPKVAEIKELVSWLMNEGRVAEARALSFACGSVSRASIEYGQDSD
jgi:ParB/RepB/Spo0J family partition protein